MQLIHNGDLLVKCHSFNEKNVSNFWIDQKKDVFREDQKN